VQPYRNISAFNFFHFDFVQLAHNAYFVYKINFESTFIRGNALCKICFALHMCLHSMRLIISVYFAR